MTHDSVGTNENTPHTSGFVHEVSDELVLCYGGDRPRHLRGRHQHAVLLGYLHDDLRVEGLLVRVIDTSEALDLPRACRLVQPLGAGLPEPQTFVHYEQKLERRVSGVVWSPPAKPFYGAT
jgi:hypothetical protein